MSDCQRERFVHQLENQTRAYLATLEDMLGPRDKRFVFRTVGVTTNKDDVPQTYFPDGFHYGGNCAVDVHISSWPWKHLSPDQGVWQVAHESVHLLDPGKHGSANVLEEGLATWFQDESEFHCREVRQYIGDNMDHSESYKEAKRLVQKCDPLLLCSAVKAIRAPGVRIRDINEMMLESRLPGVSVSVIGALCKPFCAAGVSNG